MPGKKKKIYHQKFGATYAYTKQITLFQYRYFLFLAYTYFLWNQQSLYLAKFENIIENVAD